MSTYNVHAGHSLLCRGASGALDEVTEDREVKNRVVRLLKAAGHTVYDCTDDNGRTASENLNAIVEKCNAHIVDLDISIHLNAGRSDVKGDGRTGGVEVWGYNNDTKDIGSKICAEIALALNITNRGFKTNQNYYVLKHTRAQAIIIECCFVDDRDDAEHWNAEKCAQAIVKGITGHVITTATQTTASDLHKYSIGQAVEYGTSYPAPTLPCGIQYATGGNGHGIITAIVSGQAKYKLDNDLYVNDGDIRGLYTEPVLVSQPQVNYYPRYTGVSVSIVDALQTICEDSSFANRKKIAERNGITTYIGSADQNNKLLSLLKNGKLVK
ncbi:MAG: N-acetylmuramoyl-L-alanine amidase [Lachnospiraceae bacterium]|nr:N-acetylmuramoyl-L-alanine amidase [Lachnospiraceae bacterium]